MRREMRKPSKIQVGLYAAHMVDINEYLAAFPEAKASETIVEKKLN